MSEYQLDFIRRYQSLFHSYHNFPLPVVICNSQWKVHFSNDLANRYYEGATTTQGLARLLGEFDRDALLREAVETGNCTLHEVLPPSSVNLSITPIWEEGKPAGLILIFMRMDNYIDSKVYYQGSRMAGALADGIRETVGELLGVLDATYLKAELMGAAWMQESFNLVTLGGYRILRLSSNLTEYARYQSGLLGLQPEDQDLRAYLKGVEGAARSIADTVGVPLRFRLPEQALYASVDKARLEAAFFNLLHNALFYTCKGNEVEVSLSPSPNGQAIRLTVTDRGLGIPPEVLPDLTRPYFVYQHAAHTNTTGLGLAIANLMAQAHDGELQIRSRKNGGTAVTLSLPASRPPALRLEQEPTPIAALDRFAPVYVGLMAAALTPHADRPKPPR